MKVLIINGSPRGERSNTLQMTKAFIGGMKKAVDVETETVTIKDLDIQSCRGCFSCWSRTPGRCVINDDVRGITLKIFASDVVIYSFPLFYYSVPSKLKALIERQLPTVAPFMKGQKNYLVNGGHPPRFELDYKTVLISSCGFYPTEKSYDAIRAQFDMICGDGNYTELFLGEGELLSKQIARRRCTVRLQVIEQAGEEYARTGGISDSTRALISSNLYPPDMYAAMADEGWGVDIEAFRKADEATACEVLKLGKKIKTIY